MRIVILAAGRGSRLGGGCPKPMTQLADGRSILQLQLENIRLHANLSSVRVVVGYRQEVIRARFPDLEFVENPEYAAENTAKSLLRALRGLDDDVLWLNGDVVFAADILRAVTAPERTCMAVNTAVVGSEEVKYRCDEAGRITEVSKQVAEPMGEALGINCVRRKDLSRFRELLDACSQTDYFERAIELGIRGGMEVWAADVSAFDCLEVDFPDDLERANRLVRRWGAAVA